MQLSTRHLRHFDRLLEQTGHLHFPSE
jgi:hypothetical protein